MTDEPQDPPVSRVARAAGAASGTSTAHAVSRAWQPPQPDHPVYAKIGLVAASWSRVEHVLDMIIWKLAGGEDNKRYTACLTGQFNGTFHRHNAIIALLEARGKLTPELLKRIERERGECNNTSAKRNRIVHDPWIVELGGTIGIHQSWPKEDLQFGIREVDEAEFTDALASIAKRLEDATKLHNDLLQLAA